MLSRRIIPALVAATLALAAAALVACGGDLSGPEVRNASPRSTAGISNQIVADSLPLAFVDFFADPDGDGLRFSAESSDTAVARAEVRADTAWIFAVVSGSARVTMTATDPGGLSASQDFGVVVPNRTPRVVDTVPDIESVVGRAVAADISPYFVDPDRDSLAFSAESSDTTVARANVSGDSVIVRPVAPGSARVTVTATDPGGLSASQDFLMTVPNRAPLATDSLPGIEIEVGDSAVADLSEHFADPDGEPLSFSVESSDSAVASAAVSGGGLIVNATAKGTATVTVTATDPGGLAATQSFVVTVPNRPPHAVGTIPDLRLEVGDTITVDVSIYVVDPDGDLLNFTAESSDSARVVAGVAGSGGGAGAAGGLATLRAIAKGTATITVTATDPEGLAVTWTFRVSVPNRAPVTIGAIPDVELNVDRADTVRTAEFFSDPDGDSLAFTAVSSDSARVVAEVAGGGGRGGGAVVRVRAVAKGTATITVTATDSEGLAVAQAFTVTIPNRAPLAIATIPHIELQVGDTVTVTASRYFVDPDGDSLGFTAESSDSARVAVELAAGTAVLTVRALARGTATITVTVTDPEGLGATRQFTVTVPNRAPQTTSGIANQQAAPGDTFVFDLATRFTDPDGDSLTFTATSSSPAVATATLSGARLTVRALAQGTTRITVTATDPAGHAARQRFTVRVPNRAPNPTGTIPDTYLA
ncbi:MAG: Ig-like domain-containing protein, partial [Gemmatimonadetes bacterium]|nr:Ig-like domain-containing protein [Gemmatimonadota bacterium]